MGKPTMTRKGHNDMTNRSVEEIYNVVVRILNIESLDREPTIEQVDLETWLESLPEQEWKSLLARIEDIERTNPQMFLDEITKLSYNSVVR